MHKTVESESSFRKWTKDFRRHRWSKTYPMLLKHGLGTSRSSMKSLIAAPWAHGSRLKDKYRLAQWPSAHQPQTSDEISTMKAKPFVCHDLSRSGSGQPQISVSDHVVCGVSYRWWLFSHLNFKNVSRVFLTKRDCFDGIFGLPREGVLNTLH